MLLRIRVPGWLNRTARRQQAKPRAQQRTPDQHHVSTVVTTDRPSTLTVTGIELASVQVKVTVALPLPEVGIVEDGQSGLVKFTV
jgi:hypothetical protein